MNLTSDVRSVHVLFRQKTQLFVNTRIAWVPDASGCFSTSCKPAWFSAVRRKTAVEVSQWRDLPKEFTNKVDEFCPEYVVELSRGVVCQ